MYNVQFVTGYNAHLYDLYAKHSTSTWTVNAKIYKEGRGPREHIWKPLRKKYPPISMPANKWFKMWYPFSHKAQAQVEAILEFINTDKTHLVWLDADVVQYKDVDKTWCKNCLPHSSQVWSSLIRKGGPETGFMAWNLKHPDTEHFARMLEMVYIGEKIFELDDRTDIGAINHIMSIKNFNCRAINTTKHQNMFDVSPLKGYFAHYKGPRKKFIDKLIKGEISDITAHEDVYKVPIATEQDANGNLVYKDVR